MSVQIKYTINDFNNILFNGINYKLPNDILNIISNLEKELQNVDITDNNVIKKHNENYNNEMKNNEKKKNHNSNKRNGGDRNKGGYAKEITNEDWAILRNFKTTKIEVKEGVEKSINDIRILLNKISKKNYDTQKQLIIDEIKSFMDANNDSDNKEEDTLKLSKIIFDIITGNKFFSELYSELYKELKNQFDIFNIILKNYISNYKESIDNNHYIDPNVDYNGYCNYTKINDNRKALSMFIVNMYKNNSLEKDIIFDFIKYFLNKTIEYIDQENKTNEVEEITENVFIYVSNTHTLLSKYDEWKNEFLPLIIKMSQMKVKEHKSLTNRVVFKYMDIIDSLE